uniref:histone acetyltransferase n=1 Tax=Aureoumbra lagunensis TaxID=44058 RepID=A0A6S8EDF0_9STRA
MEMSETLPTNGMGRPTQSALPHWYTQDLHLQERRKMITNIARLLQARKPNAPPEWMQKLPQMARRLEESLFRTANSFDAYRDTQTLKKRLQDLAMKMGLRAQQQKQNETKATIHTMNSSYTPSSNSQLAGAEQSSTMSQDPNSQNSSSITGGHDMTVDASIVSKQQSHDVTSKSAAKSSGQVPQRSYQSDQRQQVLRQQQQRLLLLRHASKCPHDNGNCPVTPHCAGMKKLWKHIAECKDQQCQTAHCVSSRYVLSHYHRCKDPRCAVCGPVRDAIQRNHEKAKQLALKQHGATTSHLDSVQDSSLMASDFHRAKKNIDNPGDNMPIIGRSKSNQMSRISDHGISTQGEEKESIKKGTVNNNARTIKATLPEEAKKKNTQATLEQNTSLLNSFTPAQIQAHLQSLKTGFRMSTSKIRHKCSPLLKKLTEHENSWIFMQPVDPIELNLPDYFEIIKNPMDLGSIKKRLEANGYKTISQFSADIKLTFDNAILYNGDESDVSKVAKEMKSMFERLYEELIASIDAEEEQRKSSGDVCILCGCEKLLFEPTSYYCNGSCNGQRIRRNSYYYTGGRNQYHWCQPCYNELKENEPLEFPDTTLWKKELQKKKNDEMHEESWVECSQCKRWVHQICALFNGRMNKGNTIYHCPFCFMIRRGALQPQPRPPGAKNIRHSMLSHYLEKRVQKALTDTVVENSSTESNTVNSIVADGIYVRQLSNIDKTHQVKSRLIKQYENTHYPSEFPVRSKCVVLFQEIDGVDVILFGMYVYEYGHDCPQPNQRRVYVSYLDSIHYFRPRKYRTLVYHEMLIAYLAHVKQRGFHTAHLWACPPCKGDDYIFFCHPEDQKTPKDDRLRYWYISLLEKAKTEGIVTRITNLWDEYLKKDADVSNVPNFEGDYWPGEAENVLKTLEEEISELNETKSRKTVSKSKAKARSARGPDSDGSSIKTDKRDALVCRMGKIIEPMKDAFIVAYLQPRILLSLMSEKKIIGVSTSSEKKISSGSGEITDTVKSTGKSEDDDVQAESQMTAVRDSEKCIDEAEQNSKKIVKVESELDSKSYGNKDELDKEMNRFSGESSVVSKVLLEFGSFFDETEDCDEIVESEFFDTRQQFLNLCQGNHYQFDELRRAKHTSMMSLYHIHNPDVPKFTVACSHCGTDINAGFCFNSEKDADFHLCQDCYQSSHKLYIKKAPFRRTNVGGDSQGHLTEEQRRERQRSIQLHMQLLQHASGCRNNRCPSANCNKMKNLLKHGASCSIRVQGGCAICRRIWALLQIHARQCRRENCVVPKCRQLKEQFRALIQQQAQMDERRRVAMNAAYRR